MDLAGIVNILGIQYISMWSLFWFCLFHFLLDSIAISVNAQLMAAAFIAVIEAALNKNGKKEKAD